MTSTPPARPMAVKQARFFCFLYNPCYNLNIMERIGLILNDGSSSESPPLIDRRMYQTLRNQIRQWATELFGDIDLEDVGPPPTGDPIKDSDAPTETLTDPPEKQSELKFCIYDSQHPLPLSLIRERWNLQNVPIIALAHDPVHSQPHHPNLISANDILNLPLDRLLFLQKIELLVAGDQAVTPSYLFQTKVDDPRITFELGKRIHITHISETGCTIISPRPIAVGVEGTLSCSLLGEHEGSGRQVEVRVQSSVPYFDFNIANLASNTKERSLDLRPPEYEVRMRFFGLKHAQLKFLRTWIARKTPGGLPEIQRSDRPPEHRMRVALITPRIDTQSQLRSSLEQLTQIDITAYSGFKKFTTELLATTSQKTSSEETVSAPARFLLHHKDFIGPKRPEDLVPLLPRQLMKIRMRFDDLFVESIEPKLGIGESLLGANLDSWERDGSQLTKGLNQADRDTFEELLSWVASGSGLGWKSHIAEFQGVFTVSANILGHIKTRMKLVSPREGIKSPIIEISIENSAIALENNQENPKPVIKDPDSVSSEGHQYEVILVDASLIQGPSLPEFEARERILSLTRACEAYGLKNAFGNPTPIVVFNALDTFSAKIFRGTKVRQLIYDFSDRRYHAELFINLSRPELWSSPGLAVQGLQTDVVAALFRPTTLIAISEAGFSILDKIPIKPGANLQIISSLWPELKSPVWSRVRRTAETQDGLFQEDFVFLSVDDDVQKSIRNFTRTDYVQKKKSE